MRRLIFALLLVSCGDNVAAGPTLEVVSPKRGLIATETTVVVAGRSTPQITDVFGVEVNGQDVELDEAGHFEVELELGRGAHRIVTVAIGKNGERTRDVRSVSLGPRATDVLVRDGGVVSIGSVGLGKVANERLLGGLDMDAVLSEATAGPIADVGTGCEHDVVSVSEIGAPVSKLFLYGLLDGLGAELLFMPIETTMAASYMDSGCEPAVGTFDFETLELHARFSVDFGIASNKATVEVSDQTHLYDHDLVFTNVNVDEAVFGRVSADTQIALANVLTPAGIDSYAAQLSAWIDGFSTTRGDAPVELTSSVTEVSAGSEGVRLALDFEVANIAPEAWVPTPSPSVELTSARAAVAIADDAIDQVLGAMWASGDLDVTIASGTLTLKVPPVVSGAGLELGDWIFSGDGVELAIFGTVSLEALNDGDTVVLVPSDGELEAQILAGQPGDINAVLAEAEDMALERIRDRLAVLAFPVGEAVASSISVTASGGFLVIDTFIAPD